MQARAAGLAPSTRFNPILLKPGDDRTSQLVIRGTVAGSVSAGDYFTHRDHLADVVADELASLRSEFDAVICEGAGSRASSSESGLTPRIRCPCGPEARSAYRSLRGGVRH